MPVIKISQDKLREIFNRGLEYEFTAGGFLLIDKTLLLTQQKSLWRIVGQLDWAPYYGIKTLLDAYQNKTLDEYREQQQGSKRKVRAKPKPNVWKNKEEEKRLKELYAKRAKKLKEKANV